MTNGPILVTGATGRLGQAVLRVLGERGIPGVRRRTGQTGEILIDASGGVDPECLQEIQAIINCAGCVSGSADDIKQANVTYPSRLARTAREAGVKRFIQVSSFSVFGRAEKIDNETQLAPADIYGRSKVRAEEALAELYRSGFSTVSLRLPFMFSAKHPGHLGRLVSAMLRLRVLPTTVNKPAQRSIITYDAAARTLITLALSPQIPGRTLAAADRKPLQLAAIAQTVSERLRRRVMVVPIPTFIVASAGIFVPSLATRLFGSSILEPSANIFADAGENSAEKEFWKYIEILRNDAAGQHLAN